MRRVCSYDLLGVRVHAMTFSDLLDIVGESIELGRRCLIGHHNLHSVYIYHHNEKMRTFYERARYVSVDGMPLVWLGRLAGYALRPVHRLACLEYLRPLMVEASRRGWRVFYLGSKPGVAVRGAEMLKRELPKLQIAATHGYFSADPDSSENREVIEMINAYRPNVLMVGMGMPRQERWIVDSMDYLQANVVLSCGACMDFLTGEKTAAPRWMGPLLLEWAYRFFSEPRRLWKRYLLEPWFVLGLVLRGWTKRGIHRSDGREALKRTVRH